MNADVRLQGLNLTWEPHVDGVFLPESGENLVAKGIIADIPIVNGESLSFPSSFSHRAQT